MVQDITILYLDHTLLLGRPLYGTLRRWYGCPKICSILLSVISSRIMTTLSYTRHIGTQTDHA